MSISVALMAHPKREAWARDLADRLDAGIVWDRHGDRAETGLRAIQAHDPKASHHLVVQDDAIICRDLIPALELAVKVSEDRIVGLYWMRTDPAMYMAKVFQRARRKPWVSCDTIGGGVAILFPVAGIARFAEAYETQDHAAHDIRVLRAARDLGVEVWHTSPSLVDHRDELSLIPDRIAVGMRVAERFIGDDVSALSIDWTAGVHHAR